MYVPSHVYSHIHMTSTKLGEILHPLPLALLRKYSTDKILVILTKQIKAQRIQHQIQQNATVMQFLFPGNAVASLLIYKSEQFKLSLMSLPWKKATKQFMKAPLKKIPLKLIERWVLFLKFTSQETIVLISIHSPVIKVQSTISADRT